MNISGIVALDRKNAIGYQDKLLWHLPEDFKWFKAHTLHKTLVMGRKTFESLPNGPLKHRQHWILTRGCEKKFSESSIVHFKSMDDVLKKATELQLPELMIIGGGQIYNLFLPHFNRLFITHVEADIALADAFFPAIDLSGWKKKKAMHFEADDRHCFSFECVEYERASKKNLGNASS